MVAIFKFTDIHQEPLIRNGEDGAFFDPNPGIKHKDRKHAGFPTLFEKLYFEDQFVRR